MGTALLEGGENEAGLHHMYQAQALLSELAAGPDAAALRECNLLIFA